MSARNKGFPQPRGAYLVPVPDRQGRLRPVLVIDDRKPPNKLPPAQTFNRGSARPGFGRKLTPGQAARLGLAVGRRLDPAKFLDSVEWIIETWQSAQEVPPQYVLNGWRQCPEYSLCATAPDHKQVGLGSTCGTTTSGCLGGQAFPADSVIGIDEALHPNITEVKFIRDELWQFGKRYTVTARFVRDGALVDPGPQYQEGYTRQPVRMIRPLPYPDWVPWADPFVRNPVTDYLRHPVPITNRNIRRKENPNRSPHEQPQFGPRPNQFPRPFPWTRPVPGPNPNPDQPPVPETIVLPQPQPAPNSPPQPNPQPNPGTANPGKPVVRKPPEPGTKERKLGIKRAGVEIGVRLIASNATELLDVVEALYKSLPDNSPCKHKFKPTMKQKVQAVYKCFNDVDMETFTEEWLKNQNEDFTFGKIGQISADAARQAGRGALGFQAGPWDTISQDMGKELKHQEMLEKRQRRRDERRRYFRATEKERRGDFSPGP